MLKDLPEPTKKSTPGKWIFLVLIMIETFMIVLYSIFVQYGKFGNSRFSYNYSSETQDHITQVYPSLQDVNVMIFIGFGFVMAYFRNYSWSAIAVSFGVAAWTIQMAILTNGWWYAIFSGDWAHKISVNCYSLLDAENTAGAVLVAFGAIMGKLNIAQYFIMATMIIITQTFMNQLTFVSLLANDIGGGMYIFLFGAVFGLSVAFFVKKLDQTNCQNYISGRHSNIFGMLGTLFLWVYWPSWNSIWATGNSQLRAIINTILSLSGSCVMSFLVSPILSNGKLSMRHILFGTISGGVVMGSIADMLIYPWASFFIGCVTGTVSVLGLHLVTPRMNTSRFQDSCGILFLAGIPGLSSGLISAILAGIANVGDYGSGIYDIFPLYQNNVRSAGNQAGYQLCVLIIVIVIANLCGIATGLLLNYTCFINIESLFDDKEIFNTVENQEDSAFARRVSIEMQHTNKSSGKDSDRNELKTKVNMETAKEQAKSNREEEPQEPQEQNNEDSEIRHIEIHIDALE